MVTIYRILCYGHPFERDAPISGIRKTLIACVYKVLAYTLLTVCMSMKVERKKFDFDYSEYLGTDYKKNEQPKFVSTYISNHVSWTDIIVYIFQYQPAFAAKKELRSIPVFGLLCQALGCIFIARGGNQQEREQIIADIGERQ